MDKPTDISSYRDAILHFCDVPDNIQEEKPSFFNFENNWLRTDGRTDGPTDRPSYRDAWTHLKIVVTPGCNDTASYKMKIKAKALCNSCGNSTICCYLISIQIPKITLGTGFSAD